jgi:hypothetical protein
MKPVPFIPRKTWIEIGRKRRRHWYRQINRECALPGRKINPAFITAEYYIKFPVASDYATLS